MIKTVEEEEWLRVGVAAEMAKIDSRDAKSMVASTLEMVERFCPGRVESRTKGLFKKEIVGFSVQMAKCRLNLDIQNGFVQASQTMISAGIALKTEPISMEDWTNQFITSLEAEATQSASVKASLQKFLGI